MVDVSAKQPSLREAEASAFVAMSREVLRALPQNPKGDPLEVARIAGIQAAKRTCRTHSHVPSHSAEQSRGRGRN